MNPLLRVSLLQSASNESYTPSGWDYSFLTSPHQRASHRCKHLGVMYQYDEFEHSQWTNACSVLVVVCAVWV